MADLSGDEQADRPGQTRDLGAGPRSPIALVLESAYPLCLLDPVSWLHTLGRSYLEFALLVELPDSDCARARSGARHLRHRVRHADLR